jgi:hypothetical protein
MKLQMLTKMISQILTKCQMLTNMTSQILTKFQMLTIICIFKITMDETSLTIKLYIYNYMFFIKPLDYIMKVKF